MLKQDTIKFRLLVVVVLLCSLLAGCNAATTPPTDTTEVEDQGPFSDHSLPITTRDYKVGIAGLSPANFPDSSEKEYDEFFLELEKAAELHGVHIPINSLQILHVIAQKTDLDLVLGLGIQEPEFWTDDAIRESIETIHELLEQYPQIKYLFIGNEINAIYNKHPDSFDDFVSAYKRIYAEVKETHPNLIVFTTLQYDELIGESYLRGPEGVDGASLFIVDMLDGHFDVIGLTVYPALHYKSPEDIPDDYFAQIKEHTTKPLAITETSWPARTSFGGSLSAADEYAGSEEEQVEYLKRLTSILADEEVEFVNWLLVNDFVKWEDGVFNPKDPHVIFDSTALGYNNGTKKEVWYLWRDFKDIPRVS